MGIKKEIIFSSNKNFSIVIITGLSGSGKSTSIKALEDMGFFCVDNLPPVLMPKFIELCQIFPREISKIALGIDIRERDFLKECPIIFEQLKTEGYEIEIIFLESSDEVLIKRFSETRRRHPLMDKGFPLEGIKLERERLADLKDAADKIINTSDYNVHQLKDVLWQYFQKSSSFTRLTINLISFGFRFGIPLDADIVMDVRFLPNPYFVDALKNFSGKEKKVACFVLKGREAEKFLQKFIDLANFLVPLYEKEGKTYLTIAIGCTGGRHRSVSIVDHLEKFFHKGHYPITVFHRDIEKIGT